MTTFLSSRACPHLFLVLIFRWRHLSQLPLGWDWWNCQTVVFPKSTVRCSINEMILGSSTLCRTREGIQMISRAKEQNQRTMATLTRGEAMLSWNVTVTSVSVNCRRLQRKPTSLKTSVNVPRRRSKTGKQMKLTSPTLLPLMLNSKLLGCVFFTILKLSFVRLSVALLKLIYMS